MAESPERGPAKEAGAPALADRACCCLAPPVVVAVMPPTPARPNPVDLQLCGHHYRECKQALAAAGATVHGGLSALTTAAVGWRAPAGDIPADTTPRT